MSARIAELERENAKLRRINEVLMDRVERSMDFQGNAFSLFQTAILLEGKVRERTRELEAALLELEAANLAAEEMRSFLREAIDSINEGFLLCDSNDRVVLTNGRYRSMWMAGIGQWDGDISFEELIRRAALSGAVHDAAPDPEAWVKWRLANHREPGEPIIIRMADGRWFQVSERRTRDGGIVGLHTDITEIKLSEERRRERELAEKSILLQATLDNLTQGVSVFDGNHRLVAWNHRFVHLLKAPATLAQTGAPLGGFGNLPAVRAQFATPDDVALVQEVATADHAVLEVRRNPMPGGGFVTTYTDITERKRSEEALRDSERRIRLVTDAMPAMIAYVDANRHYRFTNKGYEDWFGRPRSSIDGRSMAEVLGRELYDMRAEYVERALTGEECTFEMAIPRGPAGPHYLLANYVPHFGPGGSVLGFFALIQDITDRRLAAQQLVEAKESLERRVEERTRELTQAKAAADEANLSKTRFLAAASHDLLQPLNAARVFASVLTERQMAPRNRSLVHSTMAALDSVDELLTALLDISRLDAGVQPVEVCDFALSGVLSTLAGEYAMLAKARGLDLRLMGSGLAVHSDPRLLGRILRNYLSNALRYTPPGGRILMGCRRCGTDVLVGVWDSGPGIPADKLDEIFEEFRRLHPKVDGERGMGLGLAIVRRIARVLGHELVVRSAPGHGSLFGLRIPVVASPPPEMPILAADTQPTAVSRLEGAVVVSRLEGAVVVIIENDREILAAMRSLMENWGCRAVTGHSAAEANAALAADGLAPDLILADYHLDDGEIGADAIVAIRAAAGTAVPAVIITADYSDDLQARAQAADCHVLNKPVRRGKLRSLVAHLLSARHSPVGVNQ